MLRFCRSTLNESMPDTVVQTGRLIAYRIASSTRAAFFLMTRPSPLALALQILPGVIEKVDPGVDRFMTDSYRLCDRLRLAEVVAAKTDDRHLIGVASKGPAINRLAFGGLRHLITSKLSRR